MTHWNHRVVQKNYPEEDYIEYSIREVFYNDDESVYAYTENPMRLHGESIESLRKYLEWCLKALDQPVLVDGEVVFNDGGDSEEDLIGPFDSIDDLIKSLEEDDGLDEEFMKQ
jgi:hypothetical protein